MTRSVLVLNHFAVPRGRPGGTRHVELFGRLEGWRHLIVASELNALTGEPQPAAPGFLPVRVTGYTNNGWRRVLNWVSYAWAAFWVGIRQRRVDVVYASSPHLLAALAGWAISFLRRKPFVLEIRDLWPQVLVDMGQLRETSVVYRLLTVLENFLYQRANLIVVMAEGSRDELLRRGLPSSRIIYVPNGADPEDFRPSASRTELRERYGFTRFTAIYAGAHGPANGLDLLLEAAGEIADLPVDIVLVGGGVRKAALQESAASAGLTNVRFMNPVTKQEIPDLLGAADLGLHVLADVELFRSAISPNKVFDYMASGLPVLTNTPGLVSELVHDARCGDSVQPDGLANGLREMFNWTSDESWNNFGLAGREWIQMNQSRSAMSQRLAIHLEEIDGE